MNEPDSIDFQNIENAKFAAEKYQWKLIYRVYNPLITATDCSSNTSSNPKTVAHIGKLMKRMIGEKKFPRDSVKFAIRFDTEKSREEQSRAVEEGERREERNRFGQTRMADVTSPRGGSFHIADGRGASGGAWLRVNRAASVASATTEFSPRCCLLCLASSPPRFVVKVRP